MRRWEEILGWEPRQAAAKWMEKTRPDWTIKEVEPPIYEEDRPHNVLNFFLCFRYFQGCILAVFEVRMGFMLF